MSKVGGQREEKPRKACLLNGLTCRMKASGVRPNVVAYASLARPFAHRGEWQEVEGFATDMEQAGLVMPPGL